MPKLSFMKWYPADWMNDTRSLSAEAKGCLIDILCLMWNAPKRGVWEGSYEEFARVTGLPWESAPRVIIELGKALRVTERNKDVTLMSRRMLREEKHYKLASERQRRHRRNANRNTHVTAKMLDSSILLKTLDNTSREEARKRFIKPTPEEVTAYAKTINFELDGSHFFDHYEANGWRVGKNPMKDWKAAVRTWKRGQKRFEKPLATTAAVDLIPGKYTTMEEITRQRDLAKKKEAAP